MFNLKADIKFNAACKEAYLTREQLIIDLNNFVASISGRLWQSKDFLDTVMAFLLHLVFEHVMQLHHFLMDYKSWPVMRQLWVNVCWEKKRSGLQQQVFHCLAFLNISSSIKNVFCVLTHRYISGWIQIPCFSVRPWTSLHCHFTSKLSEGELWVVELAFLLLPAPEEPPAPQGHNPRQRHQVLWERR